MVTALVVLGIFVAFSLLVLGLLLFYDWIRPRTGNSYEPEGITEYERNSKLFKMFPAKQRRTWRWSNGLDI